MSGVDDETPRRDDDSAMMHTEETPVMIVLSPADRAQVHAILMTHAEHQDNSSRQTLEVLGRLKCDNPEELDMIDELEATVEVVEEDCENLKRIASLFEER